MTFNERINKRTRKRSARKESKRQIRKSLTEERPSKKCRTSGQNQYKQAQQQYSDAYLELDQVLRASPKISAF